MTEEQQKSDVQDDALHSDDAALSENGSRPAKRKRRWLRWLLVLLILGPLVALVGLIVVIPAIVSSDRARSEVEKMASEALQRDVEIGDIDFGWGQGFHLEGLTVTEDAGHVLLSMKSLDFQVDLPAFFSKRLVVKKLTVVEPEVHLVRHKDGTFNIDDLIQESGAEPGAGSPKPGSEPPVGGEPSSDGAIVPIPLAEVELHAKVQNALFTMSDEGSGEKVSIEDLTAAVDMPSINDPITANLGLDLCARNRIEHIAVSATAQVVENLQINPNAAKFQLSVESVPLKLNADVDLAKLTPGIEGSGGTVSITCDLAELMTRVEAFAELPKGFELAGNVRSTMAISGTPESPAVVGTMEIQNLLTTLPDSPGAEETESERKPVRIGPLDVSVEHDAVYDSRNAKATLGNLKVKSDFLDVTATGECSELNGPQVVGGAVTAKVDLKRAAEIFSSFIPKEVTLGDVFEMTMNVKGALGVVANADPEDPFALARVLDVSGEAHLDRAEYSTPETYAVLSDVHVNPLTLKNGILQLKTQLKVNEGPTVVDASVNLQEKTPVFEATVAGADIAVNQKVAVLGYAIPILILPADGTIDTSAKVNLSVKGQGMTWPEMRETLVGNGSLALADGTVSGGEIVSAILTVLKQEDRLSFRGIETAFGVSEGKIASDKISFNGDSLDFALSGWTSIIPDDSGRLPLAYKLGSEILEKYAGRDYQKYITLLGEDPVTYSPLLISGTVQKPEVKLNLPKLSTAAQGLLGNALNDFIKKEAGSEQSDAAGIIGELLKKGTDKTDEDKDDQADAKKDVAGAISELLETAIDKNEDDDEGKTDKDTKKDAAGVINDFLKSDTGKNLLNGLFGGRK